MGIFWLYSQIKGYLKDKQKILTIKSQLADKKSD